VLDKIISRQAVDMSWATEGEANEVWRDLGELGEEEQVDPGLPGDQRQAEEEKRQLQSLLQRLDGLGSVTGRII
jgi:hypothetical protein